MRKLVVLLAVVLGMLATAVPASAITGNYVEDFEHPFVGLVVFYDENAELMHRCSGSLLTSTVFLTAGHCTYGATTARVSPPCQCVDIVDWGHISSGRWGSRP